MFCLFFHVSTKLFIVFCRAGRIPYIHSYMFGDNGIRTNLQVAVSFDEKIAQAIGSSLAFVNLETELDVDAILSTMKSPQGINVMKQRIQKYRQFAPNTVLTSSPGLWKPASDYTFFKPIAALLDVKGNIYHAASNAAACTRLARGGNCNFGMTWDWANNVQGRLDENLTKMRTAWGNPVTPFITADTAITSCGWGAQGQSTIIKNFVGRMDCLFKNGWRGTVMRNKGPEDPNERAFGVENEGKFTYSTNAESVKQVQAGLNTAIRIMKTGAKC